MKNRTRFLRCVAAIILFSFGFLYGQQHFSPVDHTGLFSTIVIQAANIDNTSLQNGDEIAVFDGTLCVGAVVYEGTFPLGCPGVMEFVPPGSDPLPGAKFGNPMLFKLWRQSTDTEVSGTPVYTSGGNFGDFLTVINPLNGSTTDVRDEVSDAPGTFSLEQNYPNPFNPRTTITFHLPKSVQTIISIYNMMGKKIRTLLDRKMTAGSHSIVWNGKDNQGHLVGSGVYLLHMKAGDYSDTKQLLLIQ